MRKLKHKPLSASAPYRLPRDSRADAKAYRALYRLSSIEIWERLSYYLLMSLLVIFLATPVPAGGLGWSQREALAFYGILVAAMQILPVLGGFWSDRFFGPARAMRYGAVLMFLGHLALSGPHVLPYAWTILHPGFDPAVYLSTSASFRLASPSTSEPVLEQTMVGSFLGAVALVAIGNALFKPNISAIVGRLPFASEASRHAAFGLFHMFVNLGALLAVVVGGLFAGWLGYGIAFAMAGGGMMVALVLIGLFSASSISPYAQARPADVSLQDFEASAGGRSWLIPTMVLCFTMVLFGIVLFQVLGTLNLYAADHVSAEILGISFPVIWILSMNPIVMLIVMPPLARAWREGKGFGSAMPASGKAAFGFALITLAFAILAAAEFGLEGERIPAFVLATAIAGITIAELLVGPATLAAITRKAPRHHGGLAVGCFYGALGIGGFLSGQVGMTAASLGYDRYFLGVASVCGVLGLAYFLLRERFARMGI